MKDTPSMLEDKDGNELQTGIHTQNSAEASKNIIW
jgi:hypothetical protein